jgi:hypothetical protein
MLRDLTRSNPWSSPIVLRDAQHLYEYLTGELASLPGMRSVETAPIIRTLKRTGSVH